MGGGISWSIIPFDLSLEGRATFDPWLTISIEQSFNMYTRLSVFFNLSGLIQKDTTEWYVGVGPSLYRYTNWDNWDQEVETSVSLAVHCGYAAKFGYSSPRFYVDVSLFPFQGGIGLSLNMGAQLRINDEIHN